MYICVEGPDGVGKSTQARMLTEKLEAAGHQVLLTKEPGTPHDPVCKAIRGILLSPEHEVDRYTALFLFLSDRSQHMKTVGRALKEGKIVISDRSSLSTFVYHFADETWSVDEVNTEAKRICGMLDIAQRETPDVSFVCSANYLWSMEKLDGRPHLDRIEQKSNTFHGNTHDLFGPKNVEKICSMLATAPRRVVHLPPADKHDKHEINAVMFEHVKQVLESK